MTKTILAVAIGTLMFLGVLSIMATANALDTSCTLKVDGKGCVINQMSKHDIKNSINIYASGGGSGTQYDDTKVKADIAALQAKDQSQDSATEGVSNQIGNVVNDLSNTAGQVTNLQTALDNNGIADNGTVSRVANIETQLDNLTATVARLAQEINDTSIIVVPGGNQSGNNTGGGNQSGPPTCKPDEVLVGNECVPNIPPDNNQTGNGTGGGTGNGTGGGNGTDGTFPTDGNGDSSPSSINGGSGAGVVSTSWITNALTVLTKGS